MVPSTKTNSPENLIICQVVPPTKINSLKILYIKISRITISITFKAKGDCHGNDL